MRALVCTLVGIACLAALSCSSENSKAGAAGVTVAPSTSSSTANASEPQASQVDVCKFFSAADAQSIMGVPMKRSEKTNSQRNCMYEEVKARPNTIGAGTVSLTLSQASSVDGENKQWANLKEVRHLQEGQKNVHALPGIGDEAWFTGNTEKGKVGVAAAIVRKGKAHFTIDTMVLEYIASPEGIKNMAKKIAGQLE